MTLYDQGRILSADKVEIKPLFEETYKHLLGPQYDEFMKYSFMYLRKCLRVNTLKISVPELVKRLEDQGWVLQSVPWCKEGFYVQGHKTQHRFDIGNLIEHAMGYFYVQEAASMLPPVALFTNPDGSVQEPEDDLKVLDLCAAPGSKTTQLAQYMRNKGLLIANDVAVNRLRPLTLNLQRMGVTNALVTMNAFQQSKKSTRPRNPWGEPYFDKILVDAPCSGTGTIRRSFKVMQMYSAGLIRRLVQTQRGILEHSWSMLKPGGELVYSTCTQEPAENEVMVSEFLEKHPEAELLSLPLDMQRSDAITSWEGKTLHEDISKCIRIYPQDNDSEGFFVAKLRKKSE
jgi:NOL1/NOP2/sun family putative RNA methylase